MDTRLGQDFQAMFNLGDAEDSLTRATDLGYPSWVGFKGSQKQTGGSPIWEQALFDRGSNGLAEGSPDPWMLGKR